MRRRYSLLKSSRTAQRTRKARPVRRVFLFRVPAEQDDGLFAAAIHPHGIRKVCDRTVISRHERERSFKLFDGPAEVAYGAQRQA